MSRICIDAGHGGKDSGAVGRHLRLKESVIVANIAQYLESELQPFPCISTLRTRNGDYFVQLSQRAQIANNWKANFFVSIHLNSDGPDAHGIETLYASARGLELAVPIQRALIMATGERDRSTKLRTNLAVLNQTRMPACLVEVGFVSNRETEEKFARQDYQRLLARAIARGLQQFLTLSFEIELI